MAYRKGHGIERTGVVELIPGAESDSTALRAGACDDVRCPACWNRGVRRNLNIEDDDAVLIVCGDCGSDASTTLETALLEQPGAGWAFPCVKKTRSDYEKALAALREAHQWMEKARIPGKEEKVATLASRIGHVDAFVSARKLIKTDPESCVKTCFELLDAPGEYHVDKATGLLHFLPLAPLTARTDVVVSLLDTVVSAAGTRHMVWKDLTISVSRGTMSARGDGLGAAFDCTGCVNVSVENCNVTNAGTTCLNLVGGANNTAVRREIFLGNSRKIVSKRAHRQHAS